MLRTLHGGRGLQARRGEQGRRDVEVRHQLFHAAAAGEELRALDQHRHPHRLLVRRALVDQAVLPEREAVVAHVDHDRRIEQVFGAEVLQHAPDAVVDAPERLGVALEVLCDVELRVVGIVCTMPAVALVAHPARPPGLLLGRGV